MELDYKYNYVNDSVNSTQFSIYLRGELNSPVG
jgi:hypothetical protein